MWMINFLLLLSFRRRNKSEIADVIWTRDKHVQTDRQEEEEEEEEEEKNRISSLVRFVRSLE